MFYASIFSLVSLIAQAGGKKPESCAAMGASQILMIAALFAIFYFLLIRPQQKKAKEHQEMLNSLRKGDRVVTTGGLMGTVVGVADRFVTLEVSEKVRVRVLKGNIAGKESGGELSDKIEKKEKEDKKD